MSIAALIASAVLALTVLVLIARQQ